MHSRWSPSASYLLPDGTTCNTADVYVTPTFDADAIAAGNRHSLYRNIRNVERGGHDDAQTGKRFLQVFYRDVPAFINEWMQSILASLQMPRLQDLTVCLARRYIDTITALNTHWES